MTTHDFRHVETERLLLDMPTDSDLDELHALLADPRVWTHLPSGRLTRREQTAERLAGYIAEWEDGLGAWIIREKPTDEGGAAAPSQGDATPAAENASVNARPLIGYAGCWLKDGAFWNLGYRLSPEFQGRGYAMEASRAAIAAAREVAPEVPIVAYLLAHNLASKAVAERLGLTLIASGPDAGNPDPRAVRLAYADRPADEDLIDLIMESGPRTRTDGQG